jgi:hypothetical protein
MACRAARLPWPKWSVESRLTDQAGTTLAERQRRPGIAQARGERLAAEVACIAGRTSRMRSPYSCAASGLFWRAGCALCGVIPALGGWALSSGYGQSHRRSKANGNPERLCGAAPADLGGFSIYRQSPRGRNFRARERCAPFADIGRTLEDCRTEESERLSKFECRRSRQNFSACGLLREKELASMAATAINMASSSVVTSKPVINCSSFLPLVILIGFPSARRILARHLPGCCSNARTKNCLYCICLTPASVSRNSCQQAYPPK